MKHSKIDTRNFKQKKWKNTETDDKKTSMTMEKYRIKLRGIQF